MKWVNELDFPTNANEADCSVFRGPLNHQFQKNCSSFQCRYGNLTMIALFTVVFYYLHHDIIQSECEAILGNFAVSARNRLASSLNSIIRQLRKINRENCYYALFVWKVNTPVNTVLRFKEPSSPLTQQVVVTTLWSPLLQYKLWLVLGDVKIMSANA